MTGNELLTLTGQSGVMPVFNHDQVKVVMEVLEICHDLGVDAFEFTNRGEQASKVFKEVRKNTRDWSGFALGVGTVLNQDQASFFINEGANFIVAPIIDANTARICRDHDISWTPGCMTLSEIMVAVNEGASLIKIFPAHLLGPGFVKAIKAPCPDLNIMPTGGVSGDESNLRDWFRAGIHCVGLGSSVFKGNGPDESNELRSELSRILSFIKTIKT